MVVSPCTRGCLVVLGTVACAGAALAEPAAECELVLEAGTLSAPWLRVIEELRTELATRTDVDRCAHLRVAPVPEGATVAVTSGDRPAVRVVGTPADLRAAIVALVVVPPVRRRGPLPEPPAVDMPDPPTDVPSPIGSVATVRASAP